MQSVKCSNSNRGNRDRITAISLPKAVPAVIFILSALLILCCSCSEPVNPKIGSLLQTQLNLKKEQLENPTSERLQMMENMGMRVDDLENQRIFIHLQKLPDDSQVKELESMGVVLYLDSWIPPLDNHPTGFLLADMALEKLAALAEIDYIIRLETAERALEPQNGFQPQA